MWIKRHWREMTALTLSVLRGIVENGLEMEKVYVYLPQVNAAFSNIFASILLCSPISRQRLKLCGVDLEAKALLSTMNKPINQSLYPMATFLIN